MLKFLDNRTHQKLNKSPKKYQPAFLYGNSFQCPKQFQTKYTLFHNPSYVNPYLQYENQRLIKIPSENLNTVSPAWKNKIDLQSVQEQKIISLHADTVEMNKSKYLQSFYDEFSRNKSRFKKTKGQFTNFIEKNLKFKALGPLHGDHRDQSRINQTKRSVWLKTSKSMIQSDKNSLKRSLDLNMSIKSSISKNSQLLTMKHRIRMNRQKTYNDFRKSLQKRKIEKHNSFLYQLPKKGPQHQLTLYDITKRSFYQPRYQIYENKLTENEQVNRDIERFQMTTRNRLN